MNRLLTSLLGVTALFITGCADNSAAQDSSKQLTLQVLAAASLQQPFDELAADFTAEYPGIDVDISYAGSSTLVHNLEAGAPADVLATADEASMQMAEEAELIDAASQAIFSSNTLVGIVPTGNPADVNSLQEATAPDVQLVVCAPQIPCGALAYSIADTAGVNLDPVSQEHQVVDVLGKVRSGQADAGFVYATEAALAPSEVEVFELEGADEAPNSYPIARTVHADHPEQATSFIDYVQSEHGQAVLEEYGFRGP